MSKSSESLEKKAINGTVWVFIERVSLELFRFSTTIILARILGPKEFGLVALTSIFLAVSITFIDSGFTKALIQKKNTTSEDESTIFYFNLIVSIIFVILVNIFSPYIAKYFNEPRLENVLRCLSITLIFFAFRQIQQVILTKNLNFKLQFKANILGTLTGAIVGISLAYLGFGVWALVMQSICDSLIKALTFWLISKWRPLYTFSKDSFKQLYKYSLNLFFNDLLKVTSENIYGLLIGKKYTPYDLGLYDRGNKLASIVITNFQFSIQKVTFPLFSKVQDDTTALKNTVKKSLDLIMFFVIPCMMLLAVIAKPLTILLLSEKWIEIVPYTQLFCIYWLFSSSGGVNNQLVLALGHSRMILKLSIIIYSIQFTLLIFTINLGISWIIIGQIFSMIIRQFILMYYAKNLINFTFNEQWSIIIKYISISFVSILPAYFLIGRVENNILLLSSQATISLVLYLLISFAFKTRSLLTLLKHTNIYYHKFIKK